MSKEKSLNQKLIDEGYVVEHFFENDSLVNGMATTFLDHLIGKYEKIVVFPAEFYSHKHDKIKYDGYVVYVKLSEKEAKKRENKLNVWNDYIKEKL